MFQREPIYLLCLNFKFNPALPPFKFFSFPTSFISYSTSFRSFITPSSHFDAVFLFRVLRWTTRWSNLGHHRTFISFTFLNFLPLLSQSPSLTHSLFLSHCFFLSVPFTLTLVFSSSFATTNSVYIYLPHLLSVLGQAVFECRSSRHSIVKRV